VAGPDLWRGLVRIQGMRRSATTIAALLAVLLAGGGHVTAAAADGFGILGAAPSVEAPPYRYVALAPRARHPLTVVEKIDLRDSTIDRWWHLRGSWYVPAVAADRSPGGLSADGGTLVLVTFPRVYPPKRTRLAILDTRVFLRHTGGEGRPRHAIRRLSLPGAFGFDAISPDGSRIYLVQNFYRGPRLARYEVRALDTASGRLLPGPIVDPEEPDERMQGSPVSRIGSPDGRWAYTLYTGGEETFLHALDTVRGRAVCVDLPQLEDLREPFQLRLRLDGDGGRVLVSSRDTRDAPVSPLLAVDTKTFEVHQHLWTQFRSAAMFGQAF
jgi:hypothetical protein